MVLTRLLGRLLLYIVALPYTFTLYLFSDRSSRCGARIASPTDSAPIPLFTERMPYTPPSRRSPAASQSTTPKHSLPTSFSKQQEQDAALSKLSSKSSLPHSSSYLNRHRRSPSDNKPCFLLGTDNEDKETKNGIAADEDAKSHSPITISTAIKDSPTTSSSYSPSDDEDNGRRGRARDPPNLAELQAAIILIEQHRESSPARVSEERLKARATLGLKLPRVDPEANEHASNPNTTAPLPLSQTARKISHSRSNTDMGALLDIPNDLFDVPLRSASDTDLEDLEESQSRLLPIPVRKKSGELVKPAITKGGLRRRPSSMPGTPTYSKAVHFDASSLEHVRTFCGTDKPIVVSAGTSPAEQYTNDIEFPFGEPSTQARKPEYEWEIRLSNFPPETLSRTSMPVRVERIYLSSDNKNLMGCIAVANLAFHKTVVARFTLDYWKTTSEVVADYSTDVRRKLLNDGCDRFVFSIKLEDQANLESKTLFFCVRYNVNGQEYWDNNYSLNYQVNFSRKPKNAKQGTSETSLPLPRSKSSHSTSSVRPRSFPCGFDDFDNIDSGFDFAKFQPPASQVVGDSPIRFRSQKHGEEIVPDAPAQRSNGSGEFSNRYNFGASLHNAIAAASPGLGERGDPEYGPRKQSSVKQMSFAKQPIVDSGSLPSTKGLDSSALAGQKSSINGHVPMVTSNPAALTAEKPSLQSKTYQDLIDTYCFYGTSKSNAPKPPAAASTKSQPRSQPSSQPPPQLDGAVEEPVPAKAEPAPVSAKVQPKSQLREENKTPSRVTSPPSVRSHSPATSNGPGSGPGSRAASPVSFGYPYTQPMQNGLFAESHTPTAIRG